MKQHRIKRLVAQFQFVAGTAPAIELPKGYDYESLLLRISGTLDVTVAGAAVRVEAPTQLIQRVELSSNGQLTHYSAPFWHSVFAGHDEADNSNEAQSMAVPPTAAAIAAYAVEATGMVKLHTPDGERPKDSNLVTMGMTLFTLRLTFGQPTDVLTGAPTATFTGTVDVYSNEIVEQIDPATEKRSMPSLLRKVTTQEVPATATTDNLEMLLPAGNLFKSICLRAQAGTGEPSTAILNKASLESGTDVRAKLSAAALRYENARMFGWQKSGYYVIDLTRTGKFAQLSNLWDLTKQAQPKLIADVTGAASQKLQGVITEYITLAR